MCLRYVPADLAEFPENIILPGEDEAFQITASILMAFCKGNLSVDDLLKLKSILSRLSNDKVTLNLKGFFESVTMNIAISSCITFLPILKLRWGFVCILLNTFYPIDQLFLNPFETISVPRHFLGPIF